VSDIRWGYASSKDAESWSGCCLTREQAIDEAIDEYRDEDGYDGFWIHSGHLVAVETVMPDVDDLLEGMGERAGDEAGEVAEDYPGVTNEARVELEGLIRGWIERHAKPGFWVADGECEFVPACRREVRP
jgi:hypothetical protein